MPFDPNSAQEELLHDLANTNFTTSEQNYTDANINKTDATDAKAIALAGRSTSTDPLQLGLGDDLMTLANIKMDLALIGLNEGATAKFLADTQYNAGEFFWTTSDFTNAATAYSNSLGNTTPTTNYAKAILNLSVASQYYGQAIGLYIEAFIAYTEIIA